MDQRVPSIALTGVAELVASYGRCPIELAQRLGLDPEIFNRSDILIAEVVVNDIFEEASKFCGDRFFALKLAQYKDIESLAVIRLLLGRAKTAAEVLAILAAKLETHAQGLSVYIVHGHKTVSINLEVRRLELRHLDAAPRNTEITQMIEHALAVLNNVLAVLFGRQWQPVHVQFRHAKPNNREPLVQVFGEQIFFNQDVNAIHLSHADWQCKNLTSFGAAEQKSAFELGASRTQVPIEVQVDRAIRQLLNGDGGNATVVAKMLGLPLRTLQYKLKQKQSSFQILYDVVRLDFSKYYLLHSDLSVTGIAERLHFGSLATFSKFFKAKTGSSPQAYLKS